MNISDDLSDKEILRKSLWNTKKLFKGEGRATTSFYNLLRDDRCNEIRRHEFRWMAVADSLIPTRPVKVIIVSIWHTD